MDWIYKVYSMIYIVLSFVVDRGESYLRVWCHRYLLVKVWSGLTARMRGKKTLQTLRSVLYSALHLCLHAQSVLHLPHLSIPLSGSSGAYGVRWVILGLRQLLLEGSDCLYTIHWSFVTSSIPWFHHKLQSSPPHFIDYMWHIIDCQFDKPVTYD